MSARPVMDWAGMLRVGLSQLRLKPAEFWALSPIELMLMLGLAEGSAPMARSRLDELAQAFPDTGAPRRNHTGTQTGDPKE